VRRILEIEMQYLPLDERESLAVHRAPEREGWTTTIERGNTAAARPLALEGITEFDPRLCTYRQGEWTE
jgi:hypothetical protein